MFICRCPHCRATFQVNIPPDHDLWDRTPVDEEGLVMWVCLECHRRGLAPVDPGAVRTMGHDTSHRPSRTQETSPCTAAVRAAGAS